MKKLYKVGVIILSFALLLGTLTVSAENVAIPNDGEIIVESDGSALMQDNDEFSPDENEGEPGSAHEGEEPNEDNPDIIDDDDENPDEPMDIDPDEPTDIDPDIDSGDDNNELDPDELPEEPLEEDPEEELMLANKALSLMSFRPFPPSEDLEGLPNNIVSRIKSPYASYYGDKAIRGTRDEGYGNLPQLRVSSIAYYEHYGRNPENIPQPNMEIFTDYIWMDGPRTVSFGFLGRELDGPGSIVYYYHPYGDERRTQVQRHIFPGMGNGWQAGSNQIDNFNRAWGVTLNANEPGVLPGIYSMDYVTQGRYTSSVEESFGVIANFEAIGPAITFTATGAVNPATGPNNPINDNDIEISTDTTGLTDPDREYTQKFTLTGPSSFSATGSTQKELNDALKTFITVGTYTISLESSTVSQWGNDIVKTVSSKFQITSAGLIPNPKVELDRPVVPYKATGTNKFAISSATWRITDKPGSNEYYNKNFAYTDGKKGVFELDMKPFYEGTTPLLPEGEYIIYFTETRSNNTATDEAEFTVRYPTISIEVEDSADNPSKITGIPNSSIPAEESHVEWVITKVGSTEVIGPKEGTNVDIPTDSGEYTVTFTHTDTVTGFSRTASKDFSIGSLTWGSPKDFNFGSIPIPTKLTQKYTETPVELIITDTRPDSIKQKYPWTVLVSATDLVDGDKKIESSDFYFFNKAKQENTNLTVQKVVWNQADDVQSDSSGNLHKVWGNNKNANDGFYLELRAYEKPVGNYKGTVNWTLQQAP